MSNRIRGHLDHTHRSVFHHGLIKLIICTVLQKKNRSWDRFLFSSGFTNEQGDQLKKSLIDKKFGFVKRFKKYMVEDLVQDNTRENSSCQGFKESVDEDGRKALDDKQDHVVEDEKMENTFELIWRKVFVQQNKIRVLCVYKNDQLKFLLQLIQRVKFCKFQM